MRSVEAVADSAKAYTRAGNGEDGNVSHPRACGPLQHRIHLERYCRLPYLSDFHLNGD